ncbi:ABC-2 family transporter protein [Glycomyces luteolus]|uniref:ABC-2 family transporter protein n=1 Tax=Glycomyces luteolus TaxID=2670330 RepID=A0A9X3P9A8_9ACTN|nr:ABC-2 family transporter protein [Glycomyces luteolus]MDA1359956.1 ABC-2 family transporter protein [Glycomyces luteolus]
MRHTASVYARLIAAQFRSITEYPADFWTMISVALVQQAAQLAFIAVIFAQITTLGGWGFPEMLLLIGFMVLTDSVTEVGWDGMWRVGRMIVDGGLDYAVVRPVPVMMQIGASAIGMQSAANLTTGAAMIAIGWGGAGIALSMIPAALLLFLCAVVVQLTIITTMNCANFWLKGPSPIFAWLTAQTQETATRFPLTIYPRAVRALLTWAVPLAFVNYIPVRILTGDLPAWWLAIPPGVALVLFAVAALVAKAGLRRYESSGH